MNAVKYADIANFGPLVPAKAPANNQCDETASTKRQYQSSKGCGQLEGLVVGRLDYHWGVFGHLDLKTLRSIWCERIA